MYINELDKQKLDEWVRNPSLFDPQEYSNVLILIIGIRSEYLDAYALQLILTKEFRFI